MARDVVDFGKDHRPGQRGRCRAAPQLAIDEVGDPSQPEPDRHHGAEPVGEQQQRQPPFPGEQDQGDDHPKRPAMEAHAAVPDLEDGGGMAEIQARLVEQDIAQPAAEHDAERGPGQEVVDVERRSDHRAPAHQPAHQPPAGDQPDDIGERIPAYRDRTQMQQHRVELREYQHGQHGQAPLRKSGIGLATNQMLAHVARHAGLERGELPVVAGRAQAAHVGLGEGLILPRQ